jgi:thiol-disulfide isomerase/thioredoxin
MLNALLIGACLGAVSASICRAQTPLLNKKTPEIVRTGLNHERINLSAYHGKVVLLNFWATWCAPCQLEMPRFVAWQSQYAAQGLQVIGVSMDDDPALVRKLSARLKLNYPVVMGDEKLGELYGGVLGLPVTFLIDRNGEIRAKFQGETDLNAIDMQLKSLLNHR